MLVDVTPLRQRGEKLPRDVVLRTPPVRGHLRLTSGRPGYYRGQRDAKMLAGLVTPGTSQWALPPLDMAAVKRIEGAHMIIVGIEEIVAGRNTECFRQAWWVRVLDSSAAGDAPPDGAKQPTTSAPPPFPLQRSLVAVE